MSSHAEPLAFKANARRALADRDLDTALGRMTSGLVPNRARAVAALPEFEALRDRARELKDHVLVNLDHYLERFETNCLASGGQVHWCPTAEDARRIVLEVCRAAGARTVTKSKSMIAEELGLNGFLEANGIRPIETDLGEYIVQLADEPPSHIIAPAVHKTKEQISELFHRHHARYGLSQRQTEPRALVAEARQVLRQKFLDADVGITGANFLIAESGSSVMVTNEGNGDLTQTLPRVHVVIASIEKVVATLEDATTILRLLSRSATGQEFSAYTTITTGSKRPEDADGPDEFHVILLDNGRSALIGSEFQDILRCIRCGACMNHCPVYRSVGGHAYGAVYVGPMGAVLSPALIGIERGLHLPNASSFCGRCESVCPMRIPLPKLMRYWRERAFDSGAAPAAERWALRAWAWAACRPRLYAQGARLAARLLRLLGGSRGRIGRLWLAGAWTATRELPAPEGRTFQERWHAERERSDG